jgi:hypothetical protein
MLAESPLERSMLSTTPAQHSWRGANQPICYCGRGLPQGFCECLGGCFDRRSPIDTSFNGTFDPPDHSVVGQLIEVLTPATSHRRRIRLLADSRATPTAIAFPQAIDPRCLQIWLTCAVVRAACSVHVPSLGTESAPSKTSSRVEAAVQSTCEQAQITQSRSLKATVRGSSPWRRTR